MSKFSETDRAELRALFNQLADLQAGTMLVISFDPPASLSCKWSASVARAIPHQWHKGSSARSLARLRLNSAVALCLPLCVVVMLFSCLSRASLGLARYRLLSCCVLSLCTTSPHTLRMSLWLPECFIVKDGHQSYL